MKRRFLILFAFIAPVFILLVWPVYGLPTAVFLGSAWAAALACPIAWIWSVVVGYRDVRREQDEAVQRYLADEGRRR